MKKPLLSIRNVRKAYEATVALEDFSLDIYPQSIFGLLGPNGAGKTTLIRMITNIVPADSGTIFFRGEHDPLKRMHGIGYMPEERGLYKKMKVGEQLLYLARLKNLSKTEANEKIDRWLDHFSISEWHDRKVEELSKGMQQKIQFISTIIHDPSLIILDEPFSGLDPVNSNLIRDEIFQLRERGATIIFSTHRMEQVEQICEEIVLINKGQKLLQGKLNEVKDQFKENKYEMEFRSEIPVDFQSPFRIVEQEEKRLVFQLNEEQQSADLIRYGLDHFPEVVAFRELLPSINDIFISQVGGTSDE